MALGEVGIVLGLEVSRLARNNADWYRLLDLCGVTHPLIGDTDGIYHPGLFNDRLVLGLKGTMSEAELHVLRARLLGAIRNKAARGELHRGLPIGLVRGEADGEVLLHPDESVTAAIRAVFERFAEMGSARRVWLWFRSQDLRFPLQSNTVWDLHPLLLAGFAGALLDYSIGAQHDRLRNRDTERLGCFRIDRQLEFRGLLNG